MKQSDFGHEAEGKDVGYESSSGKLSQQEIADWEANRRRSKERHAARIKAKCIYISSWVFILGFFSVIGVYRGGRGDIGEGSEMIFGAFAAMYLINKDEDEDVCEAKWRPLGYFIICLVLAPLLSVIAAGGEEMIRVAERDGTALLWRLCQVVVALCVFVVLLLLIERKFGR